MDFQAIVDSVQTMACVVSVEKKPDDSYGAIRLVTGNKAYISSIENPAPGKFLIDASSIFEFYPGQTGGLGHP